MRRQFLRLLPSFSIFIIPLCLQIFRDRVPSPLLWLGLILISIIYVSYQYFYVIRPRFPSLDEVTACDDVIKNSLGCVRDEFCSRIRDIDSGSRLSANQIRLNIMLPVRDAFGRFVALKQFFWLGDYKDAEIVERWKSGNGNCGIAWQEKRQLVYPDYEEPFHSLTSAQRERYTHLKSIISTPIRIDYSGVIGFLFV